MSVSRRFEGRQTPCTVLFLAFFIILASSVQVCSERETGVHLEYICAEPEPELTQKSNVPVIMLHSVTDIKETWNGIYELLSSLTHRQVCIYDARNHGGSSWNDTSTVDANVEDLENFMAMLKIERAVLVGHSMGGLTAMQFALSKPSKVDGIFVEDIAPKVPKLFFRLIGLYFKKLEDILSSIPEGADGPAAKKLVLDYLRKISLDQVPRSYLTDIPLHQINGVWQWKLNLEVFKKILGNVTYAFSEMKGQYEGKALFLYATSSIFKVDEQKEEIRQLFPNVKFVGIDGYTHEIHNTSPVFMKELLEFLK